MQKTYVILIAVILSATGLWAATTGEVVRLERPMGVADPGGCAFHRGILSLPHNYIQGSDGRVVLEAEDATTTNIGADGAVGPFSSTEQNLIGTDRRASLDRFVAFARGAKWERAQWAFAVAKPAKFTMWYRIFATDIGECAHTATLNGKGGERIVVFQTTNVNDKLFHRWQWVKGRDYDLVAGDNKFVIDWHNSARLDQLAFLPAGVQPPENESLAPTFGKLAANANAITRPMKLAADEWAERLVAQVDLSGGEVVWELSRDDGKTWVPVVPGADLPGQKKTPRPSGAATEDATCSPGACYSAKSAKAAFATKHELSPGGMLVFRVKLTESAQHASPLIQAVRLVVAKPRPVRELGTIPPAMQFRESDIELTPATWNGLRFRNGVWTLMDAIQPDAQGALWMDAAKADFIDLLPASRSWITNVAGAVSGKAVRQGMMNRNVIGFDINVPKKDTYRPWFRVQLARSKFAQTFHPSATYQFDRQPLTVAAFKEQGTNYPVDAFRKQEWVWLPGVPVEVEAGVQTFRIRAGLEQTWLDRVCLAPTNAPAPQGPGGTSTRAMVTNATVTFQPLAGVMAKSWTSLQSISSLSGGRLTYSFSKDGGTTWIDLKDNNLDLLNGSAGGVALPVAGQTGGANSPSEPLLDVTLRCTLAPDAAGKAPRISAWKAVAKEAGEPLIQLANKEQRIVFDPASGDLLGWWSAQDGWIVPPGRRQPLFELGLPEGVAKPVAGSLQRRETMTGNWKLEIGNRKSTETCQILSLDYLLEGGSILAKVTITLPETGLARWKLRVENGSACQVYGLNFPIIGGVRIGSDAEANRAPYHDAMSSDGSGIIYHSIARGNPTSGLYPAWTSMGWYSLYAAESSGSFTLQTRNKDAYHIWMTYNNDPAALAMHYKFSRMLVVDPDGTGEAEYDLGWHAGDWHRSADFYRQWARTWLNKVDNPEWVRNADGWMGCSEMLASRYITHAWPNMEWFGADYSQNFARAVDGMPSCSPFPCLNPRLGTAEEFRRAHTEARKRGWYNTYYYNQAWADSFLTAEYIGPTPRRLFPKELRLRPLGFTEKWASTGPDGSFGTYDYVASLNYAPCYGMCGTGWVDMLADAIAYNFGTVFGADGVYFDQAGLSAGFCYNTHHGHGTQRAIGMANTVEGMRRAIAAGRKDNLNFAMATEGNNDQCMQYANFGLWVGSLLSDGEVFKYTFPEVQLIKGHINGGTVGGYDFGDYARHLNLFHVNDLLGSQHDVKEFYAHRKRIGDWMHGGEFQDNVGLTVSKPGIDAKWFRRSDGKHIGAAINIHNEDRIEGAVLRLKWDGLRPVGKAFAYLWGGEVKPLPVRWENDGAVVEVPSAQASTILLIAKEPDREAVRGHCFWPLNPGTDKLVLVLVNTSDKARTVKLEWNPPTGVTLKAPPARCELPAGEAVRLEVGMEGVAAMQQRGRVEIRVREGFSTLFAASCVLAPPLVNGGFETDSMGNGTPDMWSAKGSEVLTQIITQKKLPPSVCNEKEVIHHVDGFIDSQNAAEGKNALLLPGRLMLPYLWRPPEDRSPIKDEPFYFKTSQPLILKSGTKYALRFQHKQEADDGMLEVSAVLNEWNPDVPAFPAQKIPAVKGQRGWVPYNLEFTTPSPLAGIVDLQIVNKSAGKAWLDAVEIRELGVK